MDKHREALIAAMTELGLLYHNDGQLKPIAAAIAKYLEAMDMVAVPREATDEMNRAGKMAILSTIGGYDGPSPWSAMLAAAPNPFKGE